VQTVELLMLKGLQFEVCKADSADSKLLMLKGLQFEVCKADSADSRTIDAQRAAVCGLRR